MISELDNTELDKRHNYYKQDTQGSDITLHNIITLSLAILFLCSGFVPLIMSYYSTQYDTNTVMYINGDSISNHEFLRNQQNRRNIFKDYKYSFDTFVKDRTALEYLRIRNALPQDEELEEFVHSNSILAAHFDRYEQGPKRQMAVDSVKHVIQDMCMLENYRKSFPHVTVPDLQVHVKVFNRGHKIDKHEYLCSEETLRQFYVDRVDHYATHATHLRYISYDVPFFQPDEDTIFLYYVDNQVNQFLVPEKRNGYIVHPKTEKQREDLLSYYKAHNEFPDELFHLVDYKFVDSTSSESSNKHLDALFNMKKPGMTDMHDGTYIVLTDIKAGYVKDIKEVRSQIINDLNQKATQIEHNKIRAVKEVDLFKKYKDCRGQAYIYKDIDKDHALYEAAEYLRDKEDNAVFSYVDGQNITIAYKKSVKKEDISMQKLDSVLREDYKEYKKQQYADTFYASCKQMKLDSQNSKQYVIDKHSNLSAQDLQALSNLQPSQTKVLVINDRCVFIEVIGNNLETVEAKTLEREQANNVDKEHAILLQKFKVILYRHNVREDTM